MPRVKLQVWDVLRKSRHLLVGAQVSLTFTCQNLACALCMVSLKGVSVFCTPLPFTLSTARDNSLITKSLHLSYMAHLILYLKSYASRVQKYSSSNLSCYCWATLSLEKGRNVSKVTQITNISLTQRKMLVCRIHSSLLALPLRVPT